MEGLEGEEGRSQHKVLTKAETSFVEGDGKGFIAMRARPSGRWTREGLLPHQNHARLQWVVASFVAIASLPLE